MSDKLIEQLRAQRTGKVEVLPGKGLLVRRPLEATEMPRFRYGITPALVIEFVVGCYGLTEADVLPKGVGADTPLATSPELLAEVLADRPEWVQKACDWLVTAIEKHIAAKGAAEKN